MELTPVTFLTVCPLVFLAGLIDSMAGGGGLISLPAYLIAGAPPHMALGTNKLSSSVGTVVSTVRYIKNTKISIVIAAVCVGSALLGSSLGTNLALLVEEDLFRWIMVGILPVVAVFVYLKKDLGQSDAKEPTPRPKTLLLCAAISLLIGAYDGFYGPGAGTFILLLFTAAVKMEILPASAYTKIVNLSSNIGALTVFIINGKVIFLLGAVAAAFSVLGNFIGSKLVLTKGVAVVRPVMLIVLALLLIKLITGM